MKKKESKNFKQLDVITRTKLQAFIESKYTASQIAKELNVSRQTIYREIKRNLQIISPIQPWNLKPNCIHYSDCFQGIPTKLRHCDPKCPKYELTKCSNLDKFPFVCNRCNKRAHCGHAMQFYKSDIAQDIFKDKQKETREGIRMLKSEFDKIDNFIYLGIKKGQSIEHIIFTNPDLGISSSQIRQWINKGAMKITRSDLRLANKYKTTKYEKRTVKFKGKNPKLEHRYEDYLLYILKNKGKLVCEVDTVIGKRDDRKVLLTIHIKKYHFQFAYLLNDKTSNSVNNAFIDLLNKVGKELFQKVFGIILTDNGCEFDKLRDIEIDEYGEVLTQVFYCHAYNSQEKGSCENNHRLVRYIKEKGVSLDNLTQDKVNLMFSHINSLARGSLSGFTPYEALEKDFPGLSNKLNIVKVDPKNVTLTKELLN